MYSASLLPLKTRICDWGEGGVGGDVRRGLKQFYLVVLEYGVIVWKQWKLSVVPGKRCPSGCPIQVALVAERYDFEECGMFSIWCGRVSLALMWCDHIPWPCNVNL